MLSFPARPRACSFLCGFRTFTRSLRLYCLLRRGRALGGSTFFCCCMCSDVKGRPGKQRSCLHVLVHERLPANALEKQVRVSDLSCMPALHFYEFFSETVPFFGGFRSTPARRAFDNPMAIACLADLRSVLPFPDMFDFLANKFTGLGPGLTCPRALPAWLG